MKSFFEVFEQKKIELKRAGEQYQRLAKEVEAMQITARLLSDAEEHAGSGETGKTISQPQMLRAVLAERGTEMHMSEMLEAVKKKFGKKLAPNVMAAVIFRYAKRNSVFYKSTLKPNTWGLLEWRVGTPTLPLGDKQSPVQ